MCAKKKWKLFFDEATTCECVCEQLIVLRDTFKKNNNGPLLCTVLFIKVNVCQKTVEVFIWLFVSSLSVTVWF